MFDTIDFIWSDPRLVYYRNDNIFMVWSQLKILTICRYPSDIFSFINYEAMNEIFVSMHFTHHGKLPAFSTAAALFDFAKDGNM